MQLMKTHIIILLCSLVLCSGCGPKQVKGQAPFVSISSMTVEQQSLSASFDIRNINDVEMVIDSIDLTIKVADTELTKYVNDFSLTIDPNTTEEVALNDLPDSTARELLIELEKDEVVSLPFSLEGRLHTLSDGYLRFKHEGHLYPVPGRPGQYRSASSRTRERR
jgi:LEA14-like dessication related protein